MVNLETFIACQGSFIFAQREQVVGEKLVEKNRQVLMVHTIQCVELCLQVATCYRILLEKSAKF